MLLQAIETARITLDDVSLDTLVVDNPHDYRHVEGAIAQRMVEQWLSEIPGMTFDLDFPRSVDRYTIRRSHMDIVVQEGKNSVHSYDALAFYEGKPVVVEVKSLKCGHVPVPRALKCARRIYHQDAVMLIFFPFGFKEFRHVDRRIKRWEHNPQVHCVDVGYTVDQLHQKVEEYYRVSGFEYTAKNMPVLKIPSLRLPAFTLSPA
ncbi:hypothetical protein C4573_05805 [Candidatus Woesearchaeota archaeon]|nr:MAG: hypothetical protein C4573_05805 [Candidatus Woesearchaeota archaeon]